jgi:hypothetical protein
MRSGISITLTAPDRVRLEALVADRNTPQKHVWRARVMLLSVKGCVADGLMPRARRARPRGCGATWSRR